LRIITLNEIIRASATSSSSLSRLMQVHAVHRLFASSVSAACSSTTQGLHDFFDQTGTTGDILWCFQTNQSWRASPMSYEFDGQQYIAVTAGANIMSFGLAPQ